MTFGEIVDYINAYNTRKEKELKEKALMDYKLSECIGIQIACIMSDKNEPIPFIDMYGFLYSEEEIKKIKEQQQIEKEKQCMIDMINYYNSRRR